MRITVYYTNRFEGCPGGVETLDVEGPGPFRVNFEPFDGGDRWALALKERLRGEPGGWRVSETLLENDAPGLVGFLVWLRENVDAIDVGRIPFWENPALEDEPDRGGPVGLVVHSPSGAEGKEKETETEGSAR